MPRTGASGAEQERPGLEHPGRIKKEGPATPGQDHPGKGGQLLRKRRQQKKRQSDKQKEQSPGLDHPRRGEKATDPGKGTFGLGKSAPDYAGKGGQRRRQGSRGSTTAKRRKRGVK